MLEKNPVYASSEDLSRPLPAGSETMTLSIDSVPHNSILEEVTNLICADTMNPDKAWFRAFTLFYLAKIAACMRVSVQLTKTKFPVNSYTVALATSGYGKGHAHKFIESHLMSGFEKNFLQNAFPTIAEQNLWALASQQALISGKSDQQENEELKTEFRSKGGYTFTFDSGTREGVRQIREKLIMANIGSINYQVDEIGLNFIGSTDLLTIFFELYDHGEIKQKLIKHSSDNPRGEERRGCTPTNALLFGTPSSLFDGALTERLFEAFLEAGYARRSIFAYGEPRYMMAGMELTAEEIYDLQNLQNMDLSIIKLHTLFAKLADPAYHDFTISVPKNVELEFLRYKKACKLRANAMPTHDVIRRAHVEHSYSKALKIAGIFAFLEESQELQMDHYYQAIKLCEESGIALNRMVDREPNFVRLARFIAEKGTELTQPEIYQAMPFYKVTKATRDDLMSNAIAWGYRNHIIIRKAFRDEGIEVFTGETLHKTDVNQIQVSYSTHEGYNYETIVGPFAELHQLTQHEGLHWSNHSFENNHRAEVNARPGFNMIVLDVDGNMPMAILHDLMKEFTFMTYTTKRHQVENNGDRYRIMLPINYHLKLDTTDYKAFMTSIMEWLPFKTDDSADQRSKKWLSHPGSYHLNQGELLDVLPFLPRTSRNDAYKRSMELLGSMDNFERWFAQRIGVGNRSDMMIKFALALVDAGMSYIQVEEAVLSFDSRLPNPLGEVELRGTVLITAAKRIHVK